LVLVELYDLYYDWEQCIDVSSKHSFDFFFYIC
jgi:hypothetical protein